MKQLSIEEKAKRYDEALKQIKECTPDENGFITIYPQEIFPELKESEDERIKKALVDIIEHFLFWKDKGLTKEKVLAWLEKQGKETSWKPSKEEMDVLYGLAYITNQYDEHKEEVITRLYQDLKREFFNGSSYENMFPNTEDGVRRRSTIQVLEYARSLDTYNQYGKADIDKNIAWLEKQGKQKSTDTCDTLIVKGKEFPVSEKRDFGYFSKHASNIKPKFKVGDYIKPIDKCLGSPRIIEEVYDGWYVTDKGALYFEFEDNWELVEKPAWSEEDENRINRLIAYFEDKESFTAEDDIIYANWLKSLKDRIQPKQEWSEEDRDYYDAIIAKLEVTQEDALLTGSQMKFLKSLKDRYTWKPSDEQMERLKGTINSLPHQEVLYSLYQDLKKLKG